MIGALLDRLGTHLAVIIIAMFMYSGELKAQSGEPSFGMSFDFWRVNLDKAFACNRERRNQTIQGGLFLTRYDDVAVRARVKEMLLQMRQTGFRELRTHVFFGAGPRARDRFDVRNDVSKAGNFVGQYARDAAAAGFEHLHIAFGVQAASSPACHVKRWGDCFDTDTTGDVIKFMLSVRGALGEVPPLPLRIDLAPEKCAPDNLPEPLRSNMAKYTREVVAGYMARFPRDETTISCGFHRFAQGRKSIDEAFAAAGRSPAFYEVHAYRSAKVDTAATIREVREALRGSNTPVIIGETNYGDRGQIQALLDGMRDAGGGLRSVYFWPLTNRNSSCHVDVAPPYRLEDAKGYPRQ